MESFSEPATERFPRIAEILDGVYDDEVGWRPASGNIKPAHVANGLFRAVVGRQYDIQPIVETIVWWKQGRLPDPTRTSEKLLERDVFRTFRGDHDGFERFRRYALEILNADGAVFPSAEHSALTLASAPMASRAREDRGVGEFVAQLLGDPADPGSLAGVLRDRLEAKPPSDPVSTLVWPLLDVAGGRNVTATSRTVVQRALARPHAHAIVAELRAAASTLVSHERAQGNQLRTLQRAVALAAAGTQAHAQAIAADGNLGRRVPFILSADRKRSEISAASESSVALFHRRFEAWLTSCLVERIRNQRPLDASGATVPPIPDVEAVRRYLSQVRSAKRASAPESELLPSASVLTARHAALDQAMHIAGGDLARALAQALVVSYLTEYESGGPRPFLESLARKAGLLFPSFQGRSKEKRLAPSVPMLDTLVRACVPHGEALPLQDFLDILWMRFGIVVGGRVSIAPTDFSLAQAAGLDVDPSVFAANTEAFVDQLAAMGLASRYADNVTFVGAA